MDTWFLDNLEKLVPIVIALLYFLGAAKGKKSGEEETAPDPEADERARRIQEEIRRKILERQQRGKPPAEQNSPPDLPTPEVASPFSGEVERPTREFVEEPAPAPFTRSEPPPIPQEKNPMQAYEEQRRKIESQLRESRELAAKAKAGKIGGFPQRTGVMPRRGRPDRGRFARIIDDLDDPQSVRKAIILKEILDRPVALR